MEMWTEQDRGANACRLDVEMDKRVNRERAREVQRETVEREGCREK